MTAGAGRVSAPPGGWRRLVRRAGPGTVRARVTVVAGLALTAAVVLGLVVMYWLQLNSADQTIHGQLGTYATQIEQSAATWLPTGELPPSDLDPNAQARVLAPDGTVLAATRNWAGRRPPEGQTYPPTWPPQTTLRPSVAVWKSIDSQHDQLGVDPTRVVLDLLEGLKRVTSSNVQVRWPDGRT
jgi:hypothetical protein